MNKEPNVTTTNARKRMASARYSAAVGASIAMLMLSSCGSSTDPGGTTPMNSDSAHPFSGTRAADVVQDDFYNTIDATIKQSGTQFPAWNRESEDGVRQVTCAVGSQNGNEFSITLRGGAVQDPKATADEIKKYWESKGWRIETIFDDSHAPNPGVQIAATSPTGIEVVFNPIKNVTGPIDKTDWSMIRVKSDCSLDPSLNRPRTPKESTSPGSST